MNEKQKKQKGKKAKLYSRPDKEPAFYLLWVAELRGLKLSFGIRKNRQDLRTTFCVELCATRFKYLGQCALFGLQCCVHDLVLLIRPSPLCQKLL